MKSALPLAALLAACGTTSPATYRQGAPMAPAFSPAEDAPHTLGQPGYMGEPERAPRSPYTRVLPPSKEPGLWSADTPQAPVGAIPDVRVLGVALPFIPDGERVETVTTITCAARWREAIAASQVGDKAAAMRDGPRRCLVAMMFDWCRGEIEARADSRNRRGVADLTSRRIGQSFKRTSEQFVADACGEAPLTDQQRRWWAVLAHAYVVGGGSGQ